MHVQNAKIKEQNYWKGNMEGKGHEIKFTKIVAKGNVRAINCSVF
jgi:hypothetical protein